MQTSRNAILAAVVLGALHDMVLHAVVGDHAVEEPGPEEPAPSTDRAFAPGSRASADMSGEYATVGKGHPAAAVSQDWINGAEHARRQFAGHEEERFRAERQQDRDREDLAMHANFRHNALARTFANGFQGSTEEVVARAAAFYDFICFGAAKAQTVQ